MDNWQIGKKSKIRWAVNLHFRIFFAKKARPYYLSAVGKIAYLAGWVLYLKGSGLGGDHDPEADSYRLSGLGTQTPHPHMKRVMGYSQTTSSRV